MATLCEGLSQQPESSECTRSDAPLHLLRALGAILYENSHPTTTYLGTFVIQGWALRTTMASLFERDPPPFVSRL